MKVVCFAIVLHFGHITEAVEPKSVNLALETVLQFDRKHHAADLVVLNNLQNFLENIKHVISDQNGARRYNKVSKDFKFTDFILEATKILKTYNDEDLEEVFTVLDDESRKYHYKGCKFYELVDNHDLRKFMSRKLEEGKRASAETLRRYLDEVERTMKKNEFKENNKIVSLVNSLYSGSGKLFDTVLQGLRTFGHRERAEDADSYLREILSNGLRSVFFNYYSDLSDNSRQLLKNTVYNYWNEYNGIKAAPDNTHQKRSRFKAIDVSKFKKDEMNKWSKNVKHKFPKVTLSLLKDKNKQKPKAQQNLQFGIHTSNSALQSFINKMGLGSNVVDISNDKDVTKKVKNNKKITEKDVLTLEHDILLSSVEVKELSTKMDKSETNAVSSSEKAIKKPKKVAKSKKKSYKDSAKKKKYTKKPANIQSNSEDALDSKTNSNDMQDSELKDILKKYDLSNEDEFKEEQKPAKKHKSHEFENGELGLFFGGQKVRDLHYRAKKITKKSPHFTKKKKGKKAKKQTTFTGFPKFKSIQDFERSSLKALKSHYRTTKEPKHPKTTRDLVTPFKRKSFTAFAATISDEDEGLTIESFENKNTDRRIIARETHDSRKSDDSSKEHDSRQAHSSRKIHDSRQARDSKQAHDSEKTHGSRKTHGSKKTHDSRNTHDSKKTQNSIKVQYSKKDHDSRETQDFREAHDSSNEYDSRKVNYSEKDNDSRKTQDSREAYDSSKAHDSRNVHNSRRDHDSRKSHGARKIHDSRKNHNSRKTHNSRIVPEFRNVHEARKANDLSFLSDYDYNNNKNESVYYPNKSVNVVYLIQQLEKQLESVKNQFEKEKSNENVIERTDPYTTVITTSVRPIKNTSIIEIEPIDQDKTTTTSETSGTVKEITKLDRTKQTKEGLNSTTTTDTIILSSNFSNLTLRNDNITTVHDIIKNNTITEPEILFNQSVKNQIDSMFEELKNGKPSDLSDDVKITEASPIISISDKTIKEITTKQNTTTVLSLLEKSNKTNVTDKFDLNSRKTTALSSTMNPNSSLNETVSENIQDPMQLEDDPNDSIEKMFGTIDDLGFRRKKDLNQLSDNALSSKMNTTLFGESEDKKDNFDDPFKDLGNLD